MSSFRFELDSAGVVELMKSEEMRAILEQHGSSVQSSAENMLDDSVAMNIVDSRDRAKAIVSVEGNSAYFKNLETNALLKSLGGD